jgi:hypothetical protein
MPGDDRIMLEERNPAGLFQTVGSSVNNSPFWSSSIEVSYVAHVTDNSLAGESALEQGFISAVESYRELIMVIVTCHLERHMKP